MLETKETHRGADVLDNPFVSTREKITFALTGELPFVLQRESDMRARAQVQRKMDFNVAEKTQRLSLFTKERPSRKNACQFFEEGIFALEQVLTLSDTDEISSQQSELMQLAQNLYCACVLLCENAETRLVVEHALPRLSTILESLKKLQENDVEFYHLLESRINLCIECLSGISTIYTNKLVEEKRWNEVGPLLASRRYFFQVGDELVRHYSLKHRSTLALPEIDGIIAAVSGDYIRGLGIVISQVGIATIGGELQTAEFLLKACIARPDILAPTQRHDLGSSCKDFLHNVNTLTPTVTLSEPDHYALESLIEFLLELSNFQPTVFSDVSIEPYVRAIIQYKIIEYQYTNRMFISDLQDLCSRIQLMECKKMLTSHLEQL